MPAPFVPAFTWGYDYDPQSYALRWPQLPWEIEDGGVGGHKVAASGIGESYVIRADEILHVELRVEEDELPFVRAWWVWARESGQTFFFWLDKDDDSTMREYWAHSPVWPDGVRFTRDAEFPTLFRVRLSLRREIGTAIATTWGEF